MVAASGSERLAGAGCWLPLSFKLIAAAPTGANYLGCMPDPQRARAPEPRSPATALRLLRAQVEYARPEVQAQGGDVLAALERLVSEERDAAAAEIVGFARALL